MNNSGKRFAPYLKWGLIGICCVAVIALIFGFLLGGEEEADRWDLTITYHAEGGLFVGNKETKEIGYKNGAKPLPISEKTEGSNITIKREGYELVGWFREDGTAFSFDKPLEGTENIDLYARWERAAHVMVKLVGSDLTYSITEDGAQKEINYKVGDTIAELNFKDGKAEKRSKLLTGADKHYTLAGYYTDEACTKTVSWPIKKTGEQTEYVIYAKYLDGTDWTIVSGEKNAKDMLAGWNDGSKKYYLANDIDLGGATVNPPAEVKATVYGNGFTISNFTVKREFTSNQPEQTAMLGSLTATGEITDLTLRDVTLTVSYRSGDHDVYFLFTEIEEGAKVSGLTVTGKMTVSYPDGVFIRNIQPNEHSTWIIGGEQTLLNEGKITVEASCTIDGQEYQYPLAQG